MIGRARGYAMVNMIISLGVSALLVGGAVVGVRRHGASAREDQLRRDLTAVRTAITQFREDTGLWPSTLSDLTVKTAPSTGINNLGSSVALDARTWRGPYLSVIPIDPITRTSFGYTAGPTGWVSSAATGNDSRGIAFLNY